MNCNTFSKENHGNFFLQRASCANIVKSKYGVEMSRIVLLLFNRAAVDTDMKTGRGCRGVEASKRD